MDSKSDSDQANVTEAMSLSNMHHSSYEDWTCEELLQ